MPEAELPDPINTTRIDTQIEGSGDRYPMIGANRTHVCSAPGVRGRLDSSTLSPAALLVSADCDSSWLKVQSRFKESLQRVASKTRWIGDTARRVGEIKRKIVT